MNPLNQRKGWVAMLAKLVSPADPVGGGKALADMLPMLVDVPDGAFTVHSLQHVASKMRRLPTYAELRDALSEWWQANRPPVPPAIADDRETRWKRDRAQRMAEAKADWSDPARVRASMQLVLSSPVKQLDLGKMLAALVQRHAPLNLALLPPEWHPTDAV